MEYTAIRSSLEISRDMADYLEAADPQKYPPASRAQTIREINDILTGRSDAPFDSPLGRARDKRAIELMADFAALSIQVKQMELPSPFKRGRAQKYPLWNADAETPLKWIDQKRYDSAVRNGFPDGFFKQSYFDRVSFHDLPDDVDCTGSTFASCRFTACRVKGTLFEDCTVRDTDFSNCRLDFCLFAYAGLSHVRYFDCTIHKGGFAFSQLKSVTLLDCNMESVNMGNCALDGCSFARIRARDIRRLATSTITQGGATHEECDRLREQTYRALGVELSERSHVKRPLGRERGSR